MGAVVTVNNGEPVRTELACSEVVMSSTTIGVIDVAPTGTVTVSEVALAAVGVTLMEPK